MSAPPTADQSSASSEARQNSSMSKGITLGLARITRLLETLGNPHLAVPIIHVAGTNGKGSVCAYIDSILRASGLRVGRFTSPHLVHVRDSITLQGKAIGEANFNQAQNKVKDADVKNNIQASPFELLAAIAFQAFKDESPPLDLAVVEVGMGGSTDATNVCPQPLVTVITSIDMDHQAFLGNTVEEIATVKAGIIKAGRPCIVAPQAHPEAAVAVRKAAKKAHAPLREINSSTVNHRLVQLSFQGQEIAVTLPLLGSYQAANAKTAIAAVEALCESVSPEQAQKITGGSVKAGLESTRWPGRLDWVEIQGQKVLVDGAHNPASIAELANFLKTLPPSKTTFIVALSTPRDPRSLLEPLLAATQGLEVNVIATSFGQPEGMPWVSAVGPADIAEAAKNLCTVAQATRNVKEALTTARGNAESRIVICGSLYLVADTYRLMEELQEK